MHEFKHIVTKHCRWVKSELHWPYSLIVTPQVIHTLKDLLHFLVCQLADLIFPSLESDKFANQVVNLNPQTHQV